MSSVFRRAARTHRVPILLLSLLTATLLFPRLGDEVRVAVASWLPATVPPERAPASPLLQEEYAKLSAKLEQVIEQFESRPPMGGGVAAATLRDAAVTGLPTRVLHREVSPARRSFVVGVGREEGVLLGHAVTQCDSLIGVVVTTSDHAARVLRVDDRSPLTTFPAVVLATDAGEGSRCRGTGVARGTGDGHLRVSFLSSDGARVGDLVVTGAGSRLVPEGLVLGEVIECGDADRDGAFDALVRPLRELDAVSSVWVLLTKQPGLRVDAR